MLQQRFFELRMKPDSDVADHISNVALMANQLCDPGEPVSEHAVMTKILCTLPPSFRHLASTWDNVPTNQKNLKSFTLRLLKEKSQIACRMLQMRRKTKLTSLVVAKALVAARRHLLLTKRRSELQRFWSSRKPHGVTSVTRRGIGRENVPTTKTNQRKRRRPVIRRSHLRALLR
jgi:hypothetical protein